MLLIMLVEQSSLGMTNMQVTVRFRRKACHHLAVLAGLQVADHGIANEMCGFGGFVLSNL